MLSLFSLFGCGCQAPEDQVPVSLGQYASKEFYSSGGFQDFTYYAKYTFDQADPENSTYFECVSEESRNLFVQHLDDFENWIQVIREVDPENEVVVHYDFDVSLLSDSDYLYLYDDPDYPDLGNYDVYFFDTETKVLYYFHNNI